MTRPFLITHRLRLREMERLPSITVEQRVAIEAQGNRYCHWCDVIYRPPHSDHDQHEADRAKKWREVGLDPYP